MQGIFYGVINVMAIGLLEIRHFATLQLQLELVCDQGDEFRICGFSLGIAHCVSKEPLQGIQIASVPGYFDGVTDGTLHSRGCGLEGLCHLGIEHLGDGVRVPDGPRRDRKSVV